jgi:hypothetical protein
MARLIDADALRAQCGPPHWCVWMSEIDDAPTIEVTDFIEYHLDEINRTLHYRVVKDEPVKHGRWEQLADNEGCADETKELKRLLHDMKQDLCWRCGKYRFTHEGACDDCRWRDV